MKIKSGVGANLAIHGVTLRGAMNTPSGRKLMAVYSGHVPTLEEFKSAITSTGVLDFKLLRDTSPDRSLVAYTVYMEALPPVILGPDHFSIPLARAAAQAIVQNPGTPTWFVFGNVDSGALDTNANNPEASADLKLGMVFIGTVGDENSDADMKLVGGAIAGGGASYKFMDIEVTLNSPA